MWIGLDIGGANLKASDGDARSVSLRFPLWKSPQELPERLAKLLGHWPDCSGLAVTMTGELADCFATRREGVQRILAAVEEAGATRPVQVWQTAGEFVSVPDAAEFWTLTAAANWHALATWGGRLASTGTALLVDIGSTTADIIPIESGTPLPEGRTDLERLLSGELVYAGVRRTPVATVCSEAPLGGQLCPLAAELFATTHDLFLAVGAAPEDPTDCDTADGRPATRACALNRIAHLFCCDASDIPEEHLQDAAAWMLARLREKFATAVRRVAGRLPTPCRNVLVCGEGDPLAREIVAAETDLAAAQVISLGDSLDPQHSRAACAYALARLASERLR